ncbi:hypothetical protein LCGC14_0263630 [marine sediment metagenome]|uniref:RNA polymerase sigma-70 region 2 domain-containing protein n=1 Tax=marine sediment metagenome TaxID=412755 RepID=A0A0F9U5D4_9ZZZZ
MSTVSDAQFEEAVKQWTPKLISMSYKVHVPYMEREDLEQELKLILLKCLQKYDPERGVTFHTFFHRACWNKITTLTEYANRHYGPEKKGLSMDVMFDGDEEDGPLSRDMGKLCKTVDDSLELQLEILGFQDLEIPYMLGRMDFMSLASTAKAYEVDEKALKRVRYRAKKRIAVLRNTTDYSCGLRLEVIGEKV